MPAPGDLCRADRTPERALPDGRSSNARRLRHLRPSRKGRSDFAHDDDLPKPARTRTLSTRRGRRGAFPPLRRVSTASAPATLERTTRRTWDPRSRLRAVLNTIICSTPPTPQPPVPANPGPTVKRSTSTLRAAVCPSKPSEHTFGPAIPRGGSTRRQAPRPVPSKISPPGPKQGGN